MIKNQPCIDVNQSVQSVLVTRIYKVQSILNGLIRWNALRCKGLNRPNYQFSDPSEPGLILSYDFYMVLTSNVVWILVCHVMQWIGTKPSFTLLLNQPFNFVLVIFFWPCMSVILKLRNSNEYRCAPCQGAYQNHINLRVIFICLWGSCGSAYEARKNINGPWLVQPNWVVSIFNFLKWNNLIH